MSAHEADTTGVHGIADTALLETTAGAAAKVAAHESDTTAVHGIADTALLDTIAARTAAITAHEADTTAVHGIADTAALVLTGDARLADQRVPTAHASTHAAAGGDPVTLTQAQVTGLVADLAAKAADADVVHDTGAETIAGAKTFTSPVLLPLGTELLPGIAFAGDPDTGIYDGGSDGIGISTGGAQRASIDAAGLVLYTGCVFRPIPLGSAGAPMYSWAFDSDTGMYSPGADQVALATAGADRLTISAAGVVNVPGTLQQGGVGLALTTDARLSDARTPTAGSVVDASVAVAAAIAPTKLAQGSVDQVLRMGAGPAAAWGTLFNASIAAAAAIDQSKLKGALAAIAAPVGPIANTETMIVSATIPANQMAAGTTYRIRATGVSTAAGATAGSTFRVRVGTTTLSGNIAATLTGTSAAGTDIPFSIEALVAVRTAGAGGTVIGSIAYNANAATGALNATVKVGQVTSTVAVDTTAQKLVELTYISGASGTNITVHNAVIELVKT